MGLLKGSVVKTNKPFHLLVFFTYGNSLQTWADTGLMGRELLLYKKMIEDGNHVTFLTYGDTDDYRYSSQLEGINVVPVYKYFKKSKNRWINLIKSFFIPLSSRFKKLFRSADIYKTNQMSGAWIPIVAKTVYRKPLVVRCGFEMLRSLLRDEKQTIKKGIKAFFGYLFELTAYTFADKIVISNQSDIKFVKKLFSVKKDKIKLIRNFIDTEHFSQKGSNRIGNNGRRALFIGRIERKKNIENLIRGSCAAGCMLEFVGKGGWLEDLQKIAEKISAEVNFAGVVDNRDLPNIIRNYDLYILPSFYEGNPKTLLEAMSCERVVLGTDVDGIRELIDDGVTGFLCDTDSDSIKRAINKIFETDIERLNCIARNARKFAVRECSIGKVYKQEFDVYRHIRL